jgi:alpha-L-rhamnosidase
MRPNLAVLVLFFASLSLLGQTPIRPYSNQQPDPVHRDWKASWITHPTAPLRAPIVLHFRRTVDLASAPANYPVRVSADNRFILFVNGSRVGDGPARGDLSHWRYELFDLAPFLHAGHNLIAATVWNFGVYAPVAQMSDRTAFLLESEATGPESISTPDGWQVEVEPGHTALDRSTVSIKEYFASGPGEEIDAAHYDWDWKSPSNHNPSWIPAASPMRDSIFPGTGKAHSADTTGDNFWGLIPDNLPHMAYSPTSAGDTVRTGLGDLKAFPAAPATIPAGSHVHVLLDRKTLTTAYPELTVSGGTGAQIVLTYSEALYDKEAHKGDRDDVDDRTALGLSDRFLPDGGTHRKFEPLWWRTWRYLDLDITTAAYPLTLDSLKANFTAYPFEERASFQSADPDLARIWEISWRTARDDAHETYMDTPYYEQLQYVGDTRIQALISYAVANDDRLALQALNAFNDSRSPDGLTRSRYPSSLPQTIPTFSLLYIGMLHDYWMYRPNPEPVTAFLPGTRDVLGWFATHEQPDGLLGTLPWWSFIDWVSTGETPTYDSHGESCITTLEYLGALDEAADLENALGDPLFATRDHTRAAHVRSGIYNKCWNAARGLVADNSDQRVFSQQANILAVLYDVIPKDRQKAVLQQMMSIEPGTTPDGVLSASYYFRFYLARALDHAELADDYLRSLDPWRKLLPLHFSTWPEIPGNTRSDSHAWSAHPVYDLLTLVAGVEPASPGFATVRIAPHLGDLKKITARFPHPDGTILIDYRSNGAGLDADITLPGKLSGTFVLHGKTYPLKPGGNHIQAE